MRRRFASLLMVLFLVLACPVPAYALDDYDAENLDRIAQNSTAIRSAINSMSQNIEYIQEDVESMLTKVNQIYNVVNDYLSSIDTNISSLCMTAQLCYQELDSIYGTLGDVYDTTLDIRDIMDSIDTTLSRVYTRLGTINDNITTQSTNIQNMIKQESINIQNTIAIHCIAIRDLLENLTNGYDNTQAEENNTTLGDSVSDYQEVESGGLTPAMGYISDFEVPAVNDSYFGTGTLAALSFVGSFMDSVYYNMGYFRLLVTIPLTFVFICMLLGYHRFRAR